MSHHGQSWSCVLGVHCGPFEMYSNCQACCHCPCGLPPATVQTNGAVRPIVRKKAALCLLRLLRKAGPDSDMLAADAWSVKLVSMQQPHLIWLGCNTAQLAWLQQRSWLLVGLDRGCLWQTLHEACTQLRDQCGAQGPMSDMPVNL